MAVDILEELLLHIDRLTAQDLQCLAEVQDIDWVSGLRNLEPEAAVQEIHRLLVESSDVSVFLERAAWLYCWLISRQKIGPWYLIRFGAFARQANCNILLDNMARALRSYWSACLFLCVASTRSLLWLHDQKPLGANHTNVGNGVRGPFGAASASRLRT
ncbi:hypothetical protein MTO96_048854 [Rhipicephalus appendiculatus]